MELIEAIKNRRSIRTFKEDSVEREKLLEVLDAGRIAPSARNEQEWKFIVVRNSEKRERVSHACKDYEWVKDAPVILVGCSTKTDYVMSCGQYAYPIDLSIAFTHMMLRATDLGLGTCWLGAFNEKKIKQILDIPDPFRVVAVMPLGYPRFQPQPKSRKSLNEIVSYDRFKD
jgi:nitroreductase